MPSDAFAKALEKALNTSPEKEGNVVHNTEKEGEDGKESKVFADYFGLDHESFMKLPDQERMEFYR